MIASTMMIAAMMSRCGVLRVFSGSASGMEAEDIGVLMVGLLEMSQRGVANGHRSWDRAG
ncbi:hypothetical protein JCM18909_742 [Cutibacterium acnes JCM 18909]|nr:hypothetical protein JCM18909_742 [Cutibacterium acnes JCM 18909]